MVDDSGLGSNGQIETWNLLKPYVKSGEITYIPHKHNKNASAARNTGVKASSGQYIAFLDDDDIFCNQKIEKQLEAFGILPETVGVVYCSMRDVVGEKTYLYQAEAKGNVLYDFLMMRVSACTSNIMIKRDVYERLGGFDERFQRHQDWEFLARASAVTEFYGISYVGTVKHTKEITKRFTARESEKFRIKYIGFLKTVMVNLPKRKQNNILAHEYNELAKLFLREKNFPRTFYYLKLSSRPIPFLLAIFLKPLKVMREKAVMKKGSIILKR